MATQFIQKFEDADHVPLDTPSAGGVGIVNGALVLRGTATAGSFSNTLINSPSDTTTIRLNSRTYIVATSGDVIGFQSKPRLGVAGSQTVYGFQVSAQVSDGIALSGSGSVVGGHVDVYLRGTSAGTIAGDVRGLQIELTTDDAGTRNITGYVTGLRIRKAFSAGTVTGIQSAIRIEKPEVQTGSESYDAVFDFTSTVTNCWHDTDTGSGDTEAGYFAVYINGNKRYVLTYSDAPSA